MARKKHNKQRDTSEETEPRHRPVFGPSRRQEEKERELSRSREERGKGKGGGGKGKGSGEGRREGKGGGKREEAWNKASHGGSSYGGSSSSKHWQPRYTREQWAQWEEDQWEAHQLKEMELQADTGWVPGLQESRGRQSRSQRNLRRAWDPEVQGRKEKYIQKGEWPEKRPEERKEMKEGSQRWRRIKELEQQCLEERREVLAQREENLQAQREQQEELLKQIQIMQRMQEEQAAALRGLQQSQAASSSAPPAAPSGLEKSQTRLKVLLTPARPTTNRHDPKRMDETIQKWKAGLQLKERQKGGPSLWTQHA
eukprot:Skav232021  [mRNA]  locus=scaffold3326:124447:125382:+ [translate_table: standard]